MTVALSPAVSFVAGWGLDRGPIDSLEPIDPRRHLPGLVHHKLIGVARAAMDVGAVHVDHRAELVDAHERAMAEALLLEDVMLDVVDALTAAGIRARVLKGSALAHLLGPDPSERTFGDIDLLVPGDSLGAAAETLERLGAHRLQPAMPAEFERRFAKSITLRWQDRAELDLHRTLAPGPYGLLIEPADLFGDTTTFALAGRDVATIPLELHLVHAALHVTLGDVAPRLGNVRDLALLLRHQLDIDLVMRTVESWRCAYPFALGLRAAAEIGADDHPLLDWADAHRSTARDRKLLDSYRVRDGRFRRQARASLRVLGWRERTAYLRALLARRPR